MEMSPVHPLDPRLLEPCQPASPQDPADRELAMTMIRYLDSRGVGMAAPQFGVPRRLFVADMSLRRPAAERSGREWGIFFNPSITWMSEEMADSSEGCYTVGTDRYRNDLASPRVRRHQEVELSALYVDALQPDMVHPMVNDHFVGSLAFVLQHEHDHLENLNFLHRAAPHSVRYLPPELEASRTDRSVWVRAPEHLWRPVWAHVR